jgi:hypothetical protein
MWVVLNLASTLFMTGLIWFVQVVHYPLHGHVGEGNFVEYQRLHMNWTSYVVVPPMLLELISAFVLALYPPSNTPVWWWWSLFGLVIGIWMSTFFLQAPTHGSLLQGWDSSLHKMLVSSNWIRTVLWSVRATALLYIIYVFIKNRNM